MPIAWVMVSTTAISTKMAIMIIPAKAALFEASEAHISAKREL